MRAKVKRPNPAKAKKYFESKLAFTMGPADLKYFMDEGEVPNIIDVREEKDFESGHIPGAVNVPYEQWKTTKLLSKKKVNVVYCYTAICHLSARAALYFSAKGYPVIELEGGIEGWKDYEYEIEKGSAPQLKQATESKKAA